VNGKTKSVTAEARTLLKNLGGEPAVMTGRELFDPLRHLQTPRGSAPPRTDGVPSDGRQKTLVYNILLMGGQTI